MDSLIHISLEPFSNEFLDAGRLFRWAMMHGRLTARA
jgi:hypothetical protein